MSGRNENRMNNPVGRQLYQEIDPFLQENVPTSFTFHFLDFESFESRDLPCHMVHVIENGIFRIDKTPECQVICFP